MVKNGEHKKKNHKNILEKMYYGKNLKVTIQS